MQGIFLKKVKNHEISSIVELFVEKPMLFLFPAGRKCNILYETAAKTMSGADI